MTAQPSIRRLEPISSEWPFRRTCGRSPTRLYGVRQELRENLGTKDAEAARQRAPEALARLREKLNRAERAASEKPVQPSLRDVAALAGTWYRQRTGAEHTDTELADAQFEINAVLGGEA